MVYNLQRQSPRIWHRLDWIKGDCWALAAVSFLNISCIGFTSICLYVSIKYKVYSQDVLRQQNSHAEGSHFYLHFAKLEKKCSLLIVPDAVITYKYMYVYVHLNEENYLWKQAIIWMTHTMNDSNKLKIFTKFQQAAWRQIIGQDIKHGS